MHPFDRAWLRAPILSALGAVTLLGFAACGGKAVGEYPDDMDFGDGGTAGTRGSVGSVGGGAGSTGTGGRAGLGGSGGGGGTAGSASNGGAGGQAGSFSTGGDGGSFGAAGSVGMAGSASTGGFAGSTSESSICVSLDLGLAGLPMSAFPASDYLASQLCGGQYDDDHTYRVICLPSPPNGGSCNSLYPKQYIGLLYSCPAQQQASFVCGPQRPPANTPGCAGNECCYVLGGTCPTVR